MRTFLAGAALAAALVSPVLAQTATQTATEPAVTITGKIGVVSDYRFRGATFSDEQPALQGGLTATAANGLYGWVWGSTIDDYGGATTELDVALGYTFTAGGTTFDVSAARYGYPGGQDVDYWELPVSASRAFGDWTYGLGFAWSPEQDALGGMDNRYGYVRAAWTSPKVPVTIAAQLGYEDGAFAPDGKWDWSLGVNHKIKAVDVGLAYIGSDRTPDTVVASVTAGF
ncbi:MULTISPECIES: TorF family putative porin [unclassified Caulobacter]|uniref:TorF family putative porin n=1 Tax=unclassified Caulobacter TaxID=2648921 RepID=UPI001304B323|nr:MULTISPECIES: TorF family putative porin [unclassified Caulobacter]